MTHGDAPTQYAIRVGAGCKCCMGDTLTVQCTRIVWHTVRGSWTGPDCVGRVRGSWAAGVGGGPEVKNLCLSASSADSLRAGSNCIILDSRSSASSEACEKHVSPGWAQGSLLQISVNYKPHCQNMHQTARSRGSNGALNGQSSALRAN